MLRIAQPAAQHVALGRLGLEPLALGRLTLGVALVLAMLARVAADFSHSTSTTSAGRQASGSGVWLAVLGPRLLRR